MTAAKLKRLLGERPYIACGEFILSNSEAQRILERTGVPEVGALASRALADGRLARAQYDGLCEMLDGNTAAQKRSLSLKRRVLIIAAAVLLAAALFFGCTPAGRTAARAVYNAFVELIDGEGLYIGAHGSGEVLDVPEMTPCEDIFISFEDMDAACEYMAAPVYIMGGEYKLESAEYYSSPVTGSELTSIYGRDDGVSVTLLQTWDAQTAQLITCQDGAQRIHIELDGGVTIDGMYTFDDGVFVGAAVTEDMTVTVIMSRLPDAAAVQDALSAFMLSE